MGDGSRTIFTNFTPTRSQNRGWIGVACWGEFIDGAQPLGRTDSHLGSAGIGWVGAVSIGAEDGEGFGWHGDGYSGGCRGIDIGFAKNQRTEYMVVGLQNVWLTANITQTVKVLAARNRPYTQAPGFVSGSRDDHYSFSVGTVRLRHRWRLRR